MLSYGTEMSSKDLTCLELSFRKVIRSWQCCSHQQINARVSYDLPVLSEGGVCLDVVTDDVNEEGVSPARLLPSLSAPVISTGFLPDRTFHHVIASFSSPWTKTYKTVSQNQCFFL